MLTFGNRKLGSDVAIFNMSTSQDCPSRKLGLLTRGIDAMHKKVRSSTKNTALIIDVLKNTSGEQKEILNSCKNLVQELKGENLKQDTLDIMRVVISTINQTLQNCLLLQEVLKKSSVSSRSDIQPVQTYALKELTSLLKEAASLAKMARQL
jgi:hypothetical protein